MHGDFGGELFAKIGGIAGVIEIAVGQNDQFEIARLAANRVAKEEPFARACFPEAFFVPHSGMNRWLKEADQVVMIDGCFLKCIGRMLNNVVDREKIVQIDALQYYHKYTDIFHMEDVPEIERINTAQLVADQLLPTLSEASRSKI